MEASTVAASHPSTAEPTPARHEVRIGGGSSLALLAGAVALIALLLVAPLFMGRVFLKEAFFVLTLLALAQCWNLLAGYAGLVSVGQQAYVGFGAYVFFACSILFELDPLVSIAVAGLGSAAAALATGTLIFRLQGAYFAIGTWVVAEVFRLLSAQVKVLGGGTGTSLPTEIANNAWSVRLVAELFGVRSSAARDILTYWLAVVIAAAMIGGFYVLLRSRQGLALAAIRDNPAASTSIGIDQARTTRWIYVLASGGAGLVGALIFFQTARISPDAAFSVTDFTAFVLFVVVIGGIGTLEGPIVGVLVFFMLRDQLANFGTWYLMLLGGLAVVVMVLSPRGIWGWVSHKFGLELFPIQRVLLTFDEQSQHDMSRRSGK
jgi:branched-chain amino acid transport system permease protein